MKYNKTKTDRKEGAAVLLCYWFISNRHNQEIFRELKQLHRDFGSGALRIVCLNPFNAAADIEIYKHQMDLPFEMMQDEKNTGLFYQVNTYPTFILMEKNGRILHRQSGWSEEGLLETETVIRRSRRAECLEPTLISELLDRTSYKNNLSLQVSDK